MREQTNQAFAVALLYVHNSCRSRGVREAQEGNFEFTGTISFGVGKKPKGKGIDQAWMDK